MHTISLHKEYTIIAADLMRAFPRNIGDRAECLYRYAVTGQLELKHDSTDGRKRGDVNGDQVKSYHASATRGGELDIKTHVANDAATRFVYVRQDLQTAYIMSPDEWIEFVTCWQEVGRESKGNGGKAKLRIKKETWAMVNWLNNKAGLTW